MRHSRGMRPTVASGWMVLLVLVAGPVGAMGEEGSDAEAFLRGNRLYESGDFQGAINAYSGILARGRSAPELEYNLANAYLKTGLLGPAVLHYRRALNQRPTYENAMENLSYARSLTQDVKAAEEDAPGLRWVSGLRLGPGPAAAGLWFAVTVFLGLAVWRFLKGRLPGWVIAGQWGLAAAALLLTGALFFEWSQLEGRRDGVVMAKEAEVRSGPGPEHTLSFRLHEGTEVDILRSVPGWSEVRVSAELQGWVSRESLEEI